MDLVFLPDNGYVLIHPKGKKWYAAAVLMTPISIEATPLCRRGMPSALSAKFQQHAHDKVATIHCLSFGEGGAFFMAWTSTDGKLWKCTSPRIASSIASSRNIVFPGVNFKGKYPGLKAWLDDTSKGHKATNLLVVLGPDGSCYALSRGVGWYRNGLPSALNEKLDANRDDGKSVRHLQLGAGGSYWVEATDGSRSWNLKGNYPSLQEYVMVHKFTNVAVRRLPTRRLLSRV